MAAIREDGGLTDAEDGTQGFERAAVALMAEIDAKHVERHAVPRDRLPIGGKAEAGVRVDEPSNQPRGGHPIDARPRTRNPEAFLIRRRVSEPAGAGDVLGSACVGCPALELVEQRDDAIAAGASEEIDAFDGGEALSEDVQEATDGWRTCAPG